MRKLLRFLSNETGATAVEYAVILALLLLAMFSSILLVGVKNGEVWQNNSDRIASAISGN